MAAWAALAEFERPLIIYKGWLNVGPAADAENQRDEGCWDVRDRNGDMKERGVGVDGKRKGL